MTNFLEGRAVVARQRPAAARPGSQLPSFGQPPGDPAAPVPSSGTAAKGRAHGEKKIETVEVDGVVQKIIVTCGCGEIIEVHCGY